MQGSALCAPPLRLSFSLRCRGACNLSLHILSCALPLIAGPKFPSISRTFQMHCRIRLRMHALRYPLQQTAVDSSLLRFGVSSDSCGPALHFKRLQQSDGLLYCAHAVKVGMCLVLAVASKQEARQLRRRRVPAR